ncbi:hypothetical protein M758_7G066300 [Ceratodon purpureus]|nr:hypothetical protein M758_7G066300 [Ceratodon purpureus]
MLHLLITLQSLKKKNLGLPRGGDLSCTMSNKLIAERGESSRFARAGQVAHPQAVTRVICVTDTEESGDNFHSATKAQPLLITSLICEVLIMPKNLRNHKEVT